MTSNLFIFPKRQIYTGDANPRLDLGNTLFLSTCWVFYFQTAFSKFRRHKTNYAELISIMNEYLLFNSKF